MDFVQTKKSIDSANNELRDQISKYTTRLNELSVYNKAELFEKGQMLSNLQTIETNLSDTLTTLKSKINEQKQVLEKYMRDAEESFNAVRQNIYNIDRREIVKVDDVGASVGVGAGAAKPKPIKLPKVDFVPTFNVSAKKDGWTEVGRKRVIPKLAKREVAPDVFIQAVTVNNIDEAHNNAGWWCYCPSESRFCISINGKVYAGNTGVIHHQNEQPVKFFEHRRCEKVDNWKESDYYVPIEKNSNSRDVRHFTNKMKFVPASRVLEKYETYAYRLGSKETLKDDVLTVKSEDFRLFSDLTCNFLLCLTAASVEMDRRGE
jgi:hypothetical protein